MMSKLNFNTVSNILAAGLIQIWILSICTFILAQNNENPSSPFPLNGLPEISFAVNSIYVQDMTSPISIPVQLIKPSGIGIAATIFVESCEHGRSEIGRVSWSSGTSGIVIAKVDPVKNLFLNRFSQRYVKVNLFSEKAITISNSSILISLDKPDSLPRFALDSNVTAYPGDSIKLLVRLIEGEIRNQSVIRFCFRGFNDEGSESEEKYRIEDYISKKYRSGFVEFQPGDESKTITSVVRWNVVPNEAILMLSVVLEGFTNAWTTDKRENLWDVRLLGSPEGTCPPGSTLLSALDQVSSLANIASDDSLVEDNASNSYLLSLYNNNKVVLLTLDSFDLEQDPPVHESLDIGAVVESHQSTLKLCLYGSNDMSGMYQYKIPYDLRGSFTDGPDLPMEKGECPEGNENLPDSFKNQEVLASWSLGLTYGPNHYFLVPENPNDSFWLSSKIYSNIHFQIIRLAHPSHSYLRMLSVSDLGEREFVVCGATDDYLIGDSIPTNDPKSVPFSQNSNSDTLKANISQQTMCEAGILSYVSIPSAVETVCITAELLHVDVPGIRVEVNGQVLSSGGNITLDRFEDVEPSLKLLYNNDADVILAPVYLMGLQEGVEVDVDVIVIAEDGVTSSHYPLKLRREIEAFGGDVNSFGVNVRAKEDNKTRLHLDHMELKPSSSCAPCIPGWYTSSFNATSCRMCPPGTVAPELGSSSCYPCHPGAYSNAWSSVHCKHCISGTYSSFSGSRSCTLCPSGTTTSGDGQAFCNITLEPALDIGREYAVIVSFSLNITGVDRDSVILKTGISASPEDIVGNLLRADTASVFNISMEDVSLVSLRNVNRRILQANISANIGIDIPEDATEDEIRVAMAVERLSADQNIEQLSNDPSLFFGRTTKALNVVIQPVEMRAEESRPSIETTINPLLLFAPGFAGLITAVALVLMALHLRWKFKSNLHNNFRRFEENE